jgi:hypothetical protein
MKVEKDFEEFIKLLNENKVEYIIVGAYAVALYAEPRNTGDIDIFYNNSGINCQQILKVLEKFGMESLDIKIEDLKEKNVVIQLGVAPVRIDLISSVSGVSFQEAYADKKIKQFGDIEANFISKELLIKNKQASGRKKDLADLELLENLD